MYMCDRLNEMRQQSELCDVMLITDDQQELAAHRAVLAARSPYFQARFAANPVVGVVERIRLHGIDNASLSTLLDHLYTGCVLDINDANVQPLLGAASLLQLPLLRTACVAHLAAALSPETCLRIRRAADRHACPELRQNADDYIQHYTAGLLQSKDFKKLMAAGQATTLDAPAAVVTIDEPGMVTTDAGSMLVIDKHRSQRYDFAGQRWERAYLGCPSGKSIITACMHQAIFYAFSDHDADALNTDTGAWTKASFLKTNRDFQGIDVLHGTLCAVGGQSNFENRKTETGSSMQSYNVFANAWVEAVPMFEARSGPGVAVLNEQLYAVGGFPNKTTAERYTATTNRWHLIGHMTIGRANMGITVLDGKLYAVGGTTGLDRRPLRSAEVYDPDTNTWSRLADMSVERARPAVVVFADEMYVVGGTVDRRVEVFSPATGLWRTLPALMPEISCKPVACLMKKRADVD